MGSRWNRMSVAKKRIFAVSLATALVTTGLNIGGIAADAGTSVKGRVIASFEELPEDVAYQNLPVGGKKSDLNLPESLGILLYSEEPETPAPETPTPEEPAPEAPEPAPEEPAPEAPEPAPEEPAPETPEPGTQEPETPAPEEPAPEAPESGTQEPETPVPEESAPEEPVALNPFAPVKVYAAENTQTGLQELSAGEPRILEGVRWELDREKSQYGTRFVSQRAGDVFCFVPDIEAYGLESQAPLPEIWVTIIEAENTGDDTVSDDTVSENESGDTVSENEGPEETVSDNTISENTVSENTVSENEPAPFDQFAVSGGVKVSVTAPEGVFPKGSVLKVKKIDDAASNAKIEEAVREDMGLSEEATVNGVKPDGSASDSDAENGDAGSPSGETLDLISFDIKILDAGGNELQPDTAYGKASVTFSQVDIISDYLAAPGEETEGKLGEFNEKSEGKGPKSIGNGVFVIGDDDRGGNQKKTMRVYHFEDGLEGMEKLEAALDESDSAVAVETEHFSTYTWAIGANGDYDGDTFGLFKITASGARVEITITDNNGNIINDPAYGGACRVKLNIVPTLDSKSDIHISMAPSAYGVIRTQALFFSGGDNGVDTNITLDGIKIHSVNPVRSGGPWPAAVNIENFSRINLILKDFECWPGGGNCGIKKDDSSSKGSIHLLGAKFQDNGTPMDLGDVSSGFTIYSNSGENILESSSDVIKLKNDVNNELHFAAEDDISDATLSLSKGSSGRIFYANSGNIYFDSGNYTMGKTDTGVVSLALSNANIEINGGSIEETWLSSRVANVEFKGGTHKIRKDFLDTSGQHGIGLKGHGGSIKITDGSTVTSFKESDSAGATTYYLHTVQLKDVSGNAVANTAVEALTGLDSYGINDVYTDEDGKLYLWYEENGSNKLTSVTAGGKEYVYLEQEGNLVDDDADKGKYAAKEKTTIFGPYIPLEDLELDKTNLMTGLNQLKPRLTFNKKYKGDEVDGKGIYHRLKDIDWTIEPGGTIDQNKTDHVGVTFSGGASYKLTAKLNDELHGYNKEWVFYIPDYIPVKDIKPAGALALKAGKEYTLSGNTVPGTTVTVEPDNATFKTIVWSVKDPAGNTVPLKNDKFTPNVAGDYTITAVIENGKTETTPYTQDFKATCKKVISENMVTISPEYNAYTGKEVRPAVVIKDGGTTLTEGTDYTVGYKNNKEKSNEAQVIIKGLGSYTTDEETGLILKFTIADLPTGNIKITGTDPNLDLEYTGFQSEDKVAAYVKVSANVVITGKKPDGAAISNNGIKYFISDKYFATVQELPNEGSSWSPYPGTFKTKKDQENYIYAKLIGDDGAESYLSTGCIVDDETKPEKPRITSAKVAGTLGTAAVLGDDELSGIEKYYVLAVKKGSGSTPPDAKTVMSQGVESAEPTLYIPGLSSSQTYIFYAVTVDRAGNISEVSDGEESKVTKGNMGGTITVEGHAYDVLQAKQGTDAYYNVQKEITMTASADNGVKKTEYYITDKYYSSATALEEAAKTGWSEYNDSSRPYLLSNKLNYIYEKITDEADFTHYISSKGIYEDEIRPEVSISTVNVGPSSGSAKTTGKDGESGLLKYYLLVKKKGEAAPTAEEVKGSGLSSDDGSFTVSGISSKNSYSFYAVAEDRAGNLSTVASKAGGKAVGATIKVMDHSYNVLQTKQEVEDYTNTAKEITITPSEKNGVKQIRYYITNKFYTSTGALEKEAMPTSSSGGTTITEDNWSDYNTASKPYLKRNLLNYIYAKIIDTDGNTTYISSKGIWEDEIAPKVTAVKGTPKDTSADVAATGSDGESGIRYYYVAAAKAGEKTGVKPADVKSSGVKSEDGKAKIEGLSADTKYTLYAVAEDRAGNLSAIKTSTMTTKKASSSSKDSKGGSKSGTGKGGASVSGSNVSKRTAGASENSASENSADTTGIRDGVPYIEDATEGVLIGRENTSGWERIENEVSKAAAPAQIYIEMNGGTVVPKAALEDISGRDVTCFFVMNDEIIWAVNGLSFTAEPEDTDLRVRTGTKNIPSKLVNEIADVYPHTNLTIEHDGPFGFTAIMSINLGSDNKGLFANLYYYNEEQNSLEFVDSKEIDGNGRASFEFEHASDYTVITRGDALTEKTAAAIAPGGTGTYTTPPEGAKPVSSPKNPGRIWLIVVSFISFALCGFILFMPDDLRKRKKRFA